MAGCYDGQFLIVPDNGLITRVHRELTPEALHIVENTRYFQRVVSHTFHARDIIAPVAAHVASGTALAELGPTAGEVELLHLERPSPMDSDTGTRVGWRGSVVYVDHFGNVVTNVSVEHLAELGDQVGVPVVYVGEQRIGPVRRTYGEVAEGEIPAQVGNSNLVEIAVNRGRAADRIESSDGTPVFIRIETLR